MSAPSRAEIPADILAAARATQDAAEAECVRERFVYGFGTGNAKETLDQHIALALLAERRRCVRIAFDMTGVFNNAEDIAATILEGEA